MSEDTEKRLRDLELSENTLKQKVYELETNINRMTDNHRSQCPFLGQKDELFEKMREQKRWSEIKFESVEQIIDDAIEKVYIHVDTSVVKVEKRVDDHKFQVYWLMGGMGTLMAIIFTIVMTLSTSKVSNDTFENSIVKLNKIQERQDNISAKILEDLSTLKVDIGIIKTKLERQ